jgi:hypothetical protein
MVTAGMIYSSLGVVGRCGGRTERSKACATCRMHIHSSNPVMSRLFAINFCRAFRRGGFLLTGPSNKFEHEMLK